MTTVVIRGGRIRIRDVLTSIILNPFFYVVAIVSAAQTAGNGVGGKNIAEFPHFFQNRYQHSTLRGVFMPGFLAGKDREDKTGKQAYLK